MCVPILGRQPQKLRSKLGIQLKTSNQVFIGTTCFVTPDSERTILENYVGGWVLACVRACVAWVDGFWRACVRVCVAWVDGQVERERGKRVAEKQNIAKKTILTKY